HVGGPLVVHGGGLGVGGEGERGRHHQQQRQTKRTMHELLLGFSVREAEAAPIGLRPPASRAETGCRRNCAARRDPATASATSAWPLPGPSGLTRTAPAGGYPDGSLPIGAPPRAARMRG